MRAGSQIIMASAVAAVADTRATKPLAVAALALFFTKKIFWSQALIL